MYSSSLPKGRPSMYRLADASTATSSHTSKPPVPPTPVSPAMRRQLPTVQLPGANSNNTNINASADANANAGADGKVTIDNNANLNINTKADADTIFDMNDDTRMFVSPWPWPAPFNWSDMLLDGSDQDPNLHSIVDPQPDSGGAYSSDFPNFNGSISSRNSDGDGSARERPLSPAHHSYGHSYYGGSDVFDMSSNSSLSIDRSGPEFGIAQLSQLSTRLYPLYRSSCNLAKVAEASYQPRDHNHNHRSSLIDDAAFKSVTAWLAHVSTKMDFLSQYNLEIPSQEPITTGETLHNAFSASHCLLEILRGLGVDMRSGSSYSTPTVSKSAPISIESGENRDFWASFTPQSLASGTCENPSYFELSNGSSNYVRRPSQCYNTVVRHLVIACHTLLLNIHTAVLIALQHDADFRSPHLTPKNVESDSYMDGTALGDIRLVVVLQFCSYVIKRQQQAVHLYLSPQPSLPFTSEDASFFSQPGLDASTAASREAMSDLEIEVQQRLERLRQTLHI